MTRAPRLPFLAILLCVLSPLASNAQDGKLPGLLQRSPSPANTVVYLNIPSLEQLMSDAEMGSKLAKGVTEVWAISDLNTATMTPKWEAGYAMLKGKVDNKALATTLSGYMDSVGGKAAIWTPQQSYLVPMEDQRLGFVRPADRTLLAKWVDGSRGGLPVSEYLATQAARSESFLSFLLAVDLKNTFSPVPLRNRLETFESLGGQSPKAVADLLSGVQGISIIVGRKSLSQCILAVEFSESPALLRPFAASLLNEILNRNGTAAPEVANWAVKVDRNTLSFQGPIAEDTLDGVLGILSLKGHANKVANMSDKGSESGESNLTAYKSKKYFDDVNNYIDRVRKYEAQTTGYRAKWNDQQARRIEELGTLDVDPELVDYGARVASMLRGNATAIRKGNVAAGQIQASSAASGYGGEGYGYSGYYGSSYGYGYQNSYSRARDQASVGARQRMGAFGSFKEALAAIDQLTADTRRAMTAKYNLQF
ncbi:MAG: hypothetical protein Aurels2KO_28300 [Aureliella sp.]